MNYQCMLSLLLIRVFRLFRKSVSFTTHAHIKLTCRKMGKHYQRGQARTIRRNRELMRTSSLYMSTRESFKLWMSLCNGSQTSRVLANRRRLLLPRIVADASVCGFLCLKEECVGEGCVCIFLAVLKNSRTRITEINKIKETGARKAQVRTV